MNLTLVENESLWPLLAILKRKLKLTDAKLYFQPGQVLSFSLHTRGAYILRKSCNLIHDLSEHSSFKFQSLFPSGCLIVIPVVSSVSTVPSYSLILHDENVRSFSESECQLVEDIQNTLCSVESSKVSFEVDALLDTYLGVFTAVAPMAPLLEHLTNIHSAYAQSVGWNYFQERVSQLDQLMKNVLHVCSFYNGEKTGRDSFMQVNCSIPQAIQQGVDMWLDVFRVYPGKVRVVGEYRDASAQALHRMNHHHLMFALHSLLSLWLVPSMGVRIFVRWLPNAQSMSFGYVEVLVDVYCGNAIKMGRRVDITRQVCKLCNDFLFSCYGTSAYARATVEGDALVCEMRMPCQLGAGSVDTSDSLSISKSLALTNSVSTIRILPSSSGLIHKNSSSTDQLYPDFRSSRIVSRESFLAGMSSKSSYYATQHFDDAASLEKIAEVRGAGDSVGDMSSSNSSKKRKSWCARLYTMFSFLCCCVLLASHNDSGFSPRRMNLSLPSGK